MKRLFVLLGLGTAAALASVPSPAAAHAELASSNPTDGAKVRTMPATVTLTLSEPVRTASSVVVTGPDGSRINSNKVTVLDDTVSSAINMPAPAGTYTMTYEIVSADAHTVEGTITFEVTTGSPTSSSPTPTAATPEPAPVPTPTGAQSEAIPSSSDGSTTTRDALTIVGFSVIAMAGLVLLIRAGLRSASGEDVD